MANEFIAAAEIDGVPMGKMNKIRVNGRPISLTNGEAAIYATDDTCRHADALLYLACFKGELVNSSLHGSRLNVGTVQTTEKTVTESAKIYPSQYYQQHNSY